MEAGSATDVAENALTLGCFEVGGRSLAVDISHLREIVRWQPVTPLPGAPALIDGVVDLRGTIVPIVDLGRALGGGVVAPGPCTRIAVMEVEGLLLGLVVDAATEVLAVDASLLEDPPALASHAGCTTVRAVVRRAQADPIVVLSLEQLLERVYRSALPAEGGRP